MKKEPFWLFTYSVFSLVLDKSTLPIPKLVTKKGSVSANRKMNQGAKRSEAFTLSITLIVPEF
jgi:hypothetical protein